MPPARVPRHLPTAMAPAYIHLFETASHELLEAGVAAGVYGAESPVVATRLERAKQAILAIDLLVFGEPIRTGASVKNS